MARFVAHLRCQRILLQSIPKPVISLHRSTSSLPDPSLECSGPLEYVCAVYGLQGIEDLYIFKEEEMWSDPNDVWFTIANNFQLRGNTWKALVDRAATLLKHIDEANEQLGARYQLKYSSTWQAEFGSDNLELFNDLLGHTLTLLGYDK